MPFGLDRPPFFHDIIAQDQYVEDLADTDCSWAIDPSLVNLTFQNDSQGQACQVQHQIQQQQQQHQQQQNQHPTMQRFANEPELALFTAPSLPRIMAETLPPSPFLTSSLPQASHQRMASPSPSQALLSSCGSGSTPSQQTEPESYPHTRDYGMNHYYQPSSPELDGGEARDQSYASAQPGGHSCVQVHRAADAEEMRFETDEGFGDMATMQEYAMDTYSEQLHISRDQTYRGPSDEGLGASIQDGASPQTTVLVDSDADADTDRDLDLELDLDIDIDDDNNHNAPSSASDTSYTPHARRKRPAKPAKYFLPSRQRIAKPQPKTRPSGLLCKSCSHGPFHDARSLSVHVAAAHPRAFVCVFAFAGCGATFANKNEWKRHVSSQHLNLTAWVCELGGCGQNTTSASSQHHHTNTNTNPSNSSAGSRGSEFNRKDLFTQHLRRMHVPPRQPPNSSSKPQPASDTTWASEIKRLQDSCLVTKRQPPFQLRCPLPTCARLFAGATCWDERMEHVGKHLESTEGVGPDRGWEELLVQRGTALRWFRDSVL
ncbi:hmg-i/hmg-y, DNA-binding protein [Diplocarpon rosae]|nr:hmg-i/hmg-y, DNA-binding protein [Diplocarpon rosae]